jgi:hypothetical protein
LNVIERKRWVRPYLGCYLGLADDNWCCVLEDGSLSRHLVTQIEELLEIGVVSFERLATLLHQSVEGRFNDVVFVKVRSVGAKVSPFHA